MAGPQKQTFVVDMTDEVSGPAGNAADALEKLKQKIQEDTEALRALQAAQGRLKGSTVDVAKQKEVLKDKIQVLKNNIAGAQGQFMRAGGDLKNLSTKTKETGAAVSSTSSNLQQMAGSIGKMAGIVGVAIMVATTVARAAHAMASFVLSSFDAARTARITAEAFTGSAANAENLYLHVASLGRRLPQTRAQLMELAQGLSESGLAGGLLTTALRAVGTASAVLPNAGAKLKALAEGAVKTKRLMIGMFDLQGTGLSLNDVAGQLAKSLKVGIEHAKQALVQGKVAIGSGLDALEKAVQAKFGKLAGQKAISLEVQLEKGKELLATLFSKLNLEPILQGFASLVAMLDETSSSGKAIRGLFNTLFSGVGGSAKGVMGIVRGFIEGLLIGATLIRIAYLHVKIALKKAIPPELRPDVDLVNAAMYAGVAVVGLLTVAFLQLAAAIAGPMLVALAPIIAIGLIAYGVYLLITKFGAGIKSALGSAVSWIASKVEAAFDAVKAFNPFTIGVQLITWLGEGIMAGFESLFDLVTGGGTELGTTIAEAVKNALKIKSPSRVGIEIGANFTNSLARGLNSEKEHLESEASNLFPVDATRQNAKTGGASGGAVIKMDVTVNVNGGGSERTAIRRMFEDVLREAANTVGIVPAGAG